MAAIAKFISFDGGIAFSESVVKFQKRSGDAKLFPLSEIDSVSVRRPQQENRGFIRLQTKEGKLYRIFFDEDQYGQATAFKKQLDQHLAAAPAPEEPAAAPAPEPVRPEPEPVRRPAPRERRPVERPARRPERDVAEEDVEEESYDGRGGSDSVLRKWWFWLIVALLVIAIALAAVHLVISLRDRSASGTSIHSTAITIPAAVDTTEAGGGDAVPAEGAAP